MTNILEDIRDFNPIDYFFGGWQALVSSNVEAYRYNPGKKVLEVKFVGGRVYSFADVPQDIADGLGTASSPGKYFNAEIKHSYSLE